MGCHGAWRVPPGAAHAHSPSGPACRLPVAPQEPVEEVQEFVCVVRKDTGNVIKSRGKPVQLRVMAEGLQVFV